MVHRRIRLLGASCCAKNLYLASFEELSRNFFPMRGECKHIKARYANGRGPKASITVRSAANEETSRTGIHAGRSRGNALSPTFRGLHAMKKGPLSRPLASPEGGFRKVLIT